MTENSSHNHRARRNWLTHFLSMLTLGLPLEGLRPTSHYGGVKPLSLVRQKVTWWVGGQAPGRMHTVSLAGFGILIVTPTNWTWVVASSMSFGGLMFLKNLVCRGSNIASSSQVTATGPWHHTQRWYQIFTLVTPFILVLVIHFYSWRFSDLLLPVTTRVSVVL